MEAGPPLQRFPGPAPVVGAQLRRNTQKHTDAKRPEKRVVLGAGSRELLKRDEAQQHAATAQEALRGGSPAEVQRCKKERGGVNASEK